jgi:hypothetical protein
MFIFVTKTGKLVLQICILKCSRHLFSLMASVTILSWKYDVLASSSVVILKAFQMSCLALLFFKRVCMSYIQDAFQKWVSFWCEKGGYSVLTYFLHVCFQLWKHFRYYSLVACFVHCCCHQHSSWLTAVGTFVVKLMLPTWGSSFWHSGDPRVS